jgi:DNA-binding transcriptional MerR regulator
MVKTIELLMQKALPQKKFFTNHEISSLLKIKLAEIQYWETEFPQLRMKKNHLNQKIYHKKDVLLIAAIKHLLQVKKITLAGAQRIIAQADPWSIVYIGNDAKIKDDKLNKANFTADGEKIYRIYNTLSDKEMLKDEHSEFLIEASNMLGEVNDDFDEFTYEIYQECSDEFFAPPNGPLVEESESEKSSKIMSDEELAKQPSQNSKLEYEQAVLNLIDTRKSLNELLITLDKYHESDFWTDFKA